MRIAEEWSPEFVSLPIIGTVLAGTTGFQSPADDYEQERIDLAKELVTTIASVFCMRAQGHSMTNAGIFDGDIIVADRAATPSSGDIVVADVHDMRVLKRLKITRNRIWLVSEAEGHSNIAVDPEQGVHIVGVVVHSVHPHRRVRAR